MELKNSQDHFSVSFKLIVFGRRNQWENWGQTLNCTNVFLFHTDNELVLIGKTLNCVRNTQKCITQELNIKHMRTKMFTLFFEP
jgi:hypothetical protein